MLTPEREKQACASYALIDVVMETGPNSSGIRGLARLLNVKP